MATNVAQGPGQVAVLNEALHFTDPRVGGVVTLSDQSTAFTTLWNLVNQATNGRGVLPMGQIGFIPQATPWILGGAGATTSGRIEGQGGGGSPSGGATQLVALSDSGSTPFANPFFVVGGGNSGDWALEKVSITAHQRFGPGPGIITAAYAGVEVQGNGRVKNVDVNNASAAFRLNGDHLEIEDVCGSGNAVGIYVPPNLATQGDITLNEVLVSGKICTVAIASSSKFGGIYARRLTGASEPIYIWRFDDTVRPVSQLAIGGMIFDMCGIESIWHGMILDELCGTSNAGQFNQMVFNPAPNASGIATSATVDPVITWATQVTTGNLSVSGSQLTVTVPAGFYIRPGAGLGAMQVVDPSGKIAAGTTITSIVSGSWPGTSYTLQLSSTPSGTPTSTITLMMPQLGVVALGSYGSNKYLSAPLGGGNGTVPVHFVNAMDNCTCDAKCDGLVPLIEGGQPYVQFATGGAEVNGSAFGSPHGIGNQRIVIAQVVAAVAQFDAVMLDTSGTVGGLACKPADGSSKVLGIALRAVTSGAVEVVASSLGITVHNKSASAIAANALIKEDVANPGGVTTATSKTDGPAIGRATSAGIGGTSTGTAFIWG